LITASSRRGDYVRRNDTAFWNFADALAREFGDDD
jgi:hypothetical protein